jgi:hypothetical protein
MRFSKPIIKSTTQKVMASYGFKCRFHDLEYLEVGFLFFIIFSIFLELIINLRAPLQKFIENINSNVNLPCFKKILDNYVLNISTCTLLARLLKYVDFSSKTFDNTN